MTVVVLFDGSHSSAGFSEVPRGERRTEPDPSEPLGGKQLLGPACAGGLTRRRDSSAHQAGSTWNSSGPVQTIDSTFCLLISCFYFSLSFTPCPPTEPSPLSFLSNNRLQRRCKYVSHQIKAPKPHFFNWGHLYVETKEKNKPEVMFLACVPIVQSCKLIKSD